jgi:hypothetical protein
VNVPSAGEIAMFEMLTAAAPSLISVTLIAGLLVPIS